MRNTDTAGSLHIEFFTDTAFKKTDIHKAVGFGNTDSADEVKHGSGSITSSAQTAERRHTGVVPTVHNTVFHEGTEISLGHNGVCHVQTCKFDLTGFAGFIFKIDIVDNPIVKRSVNFIFQRTEGVGNAFQCVLDRVCEVIHRKDAPFRALSVVFYVFDTVDNGVAHTEVTGSEINLCAKSVFTFGEFAVLHAFKKIKAFFDGTVTPGRNSRVGQVARKFGGAELFGSQLTNVSKTLFDESDSKLVVLFKVIGAVVETVFPVKTEPVNVFFDRVNEFSIFLCGVGIVHTEIALTTVFFRRTEVDNQRLAVSDVQITVGFGRKTGVNIVCCYFTRFNIFINQFI